MIKEAGSGLFKFGVMSLGLSVVSIASQTLAPGIFNVLRHSFINSDHYENMKERSREIVSNGFGFKKSDVVVYKIE